MRTTTSEKEEKNSGSANVLNRTETNQEERIVAFKTVEYHEGY